MKKIFILYLFIINQSVLAQLAESDTLAWQYELASAFFLSQGNVERLLVKSDFSLTHVEQDWGFASVNTHYYGSFGGYATERDLISKNFLYLTPKARRYPYLMTWLETNFRRKLDTRIQIGPGVTMVVLKTADHLVKISGTGSYENTSFGRPIILENKQLKRHIETWRLTGRIYGEHRFGDDKIMLQYELWIQPSLSDKENYRYHIDQLIKVPLSNRVALRMNANYTYETIVPISIQKSDLYCTIGFSLR